jgi:hypothetical protein
MMATERDVTRKDAKEPRYVIIGGCGKSGTTSLFYYLSDHPDISPATTKEPGFFFDEDYPAKCVCNFSDGLADYEKLFPHWTPGQLRLEATPEYIYSPETAKRIKETLPDVKLVFSLRDPVALFESLFLFAQQRGKIPNDTTLEEHIDEQLQRFESGQRMEGPSHLEMGRFALYLKPFLDLFGRDHIEVVFLEDLKRDSLKTIRSICSFCGIEPDFYDSYTFKVHNRTVPVKFQAVSLALNSLRGHLNRLTRNHPRIHDLIRWVHRSLFEPLWFCLNKMGKKPEQAPVSDDAIVRLRTFYDGEKQALEDLLGITVPW